MIIRIQKRVIKQAGFIFASFSVMFAIILGISFTTESVIAGNVSNQTVIAKVNVTNTEPYLYKVVIEDPLDTNGNVDLEAGNTTIIVCNGSFMDYNNYDDIVSVNATLFFESVGSKDADHNQSHYTNSSCLVGGATCTQNLLNENNGSCLCQFSVQYYAHAGNWFCNMTINDSGGLTDDQYSAPRYFNEIVGIDVETNLMNFGNVSVTQISDPVRQNISNVGNVPINVTVRNFGGSNDSINHPGHNLSMICDPAASAANITFNYMRYATVNGTAFANMTNVTNQTTQIFNLTLSKRTNSTKSTNSSNSTVWRLQIPVGAGGICNGTIIFGAIDAVNN